MVHATWRENHASCVQQWHLALDHLELACCCCFHRSVGEASTSYSQLQGQHADHVRSYAAPAKGGAKKGAAPPAKAAASDKPDKPKVQGGGELA